MKCIICNAQSTKKRIKLRDRSYAVLYTCSKCDLRFLEEKHKNIFKNDTFERSRLGKAGLKIPSLKEKSKECKANLVSLGYL